MPITNVGSLEITPSTVPLIFFGHLIFFFSCAFLIYTVCLIFCFVRYDLFDTNRHGTRCAGQIASVANNSFCSVGIAFNARIGGVKMLDGTITGKQVHCFLKVFITNC